MRDHRLTTPQLNEIHEIASRLQLDPGAFRWEVRNGPHGAHHYVEHPPTKSFADIDYRIGEFVSTWYVERWPKSRNTQTLAKGWEDVRALLAAWLVEVKTESETADLWQTARAERDWITSDESAFGGNDGFSQGEIERIEQALEAISHYVRETFHLVAEHQQDVDRQLKYLAEASRRVGRFDWKNLSASIFIKIILMIGLDIEKARQLIGFVTRLLGPLVLGVEKLLSS